MSLCITIDLICDHLCLRDVFNVWEALGAWKQLWNDDVIATLCRRMELRYRVSFTMRNLCEKMNNTCRCGMCGKRTQSRAFRELQPMFLCTECRDNYLVNRTQVKLMLRSHVFRRLVTMTPWKSGLLRIAKRGPTGAHLYWRHHVQHLMDNGTTRR
jgi:hypothetical protein